MTERNRELASIANASGFLFQLRVAHLISATSSGWSVLAEEHPWKDPETGEDGFIDLVIARDPLRLVLECKRVSEGAWIFLVRQGTQASTERTRGFVTSNPTNGPKAGGWEEFNLLPEAPESAFCIVRGTGEADRPLLERLAARTAAATEAFGSQELIVEPAGSYLDLKTAYIPVIVTGAELFLCNVDPADIDLSSGRINPSKANFTKVEAVRFRKALTTNLDLTPFSNIQSVNRVAERTVFVVNATSLPEWLLRLQI
jgi:hypothetical protein